MLCSTALFFCPFAAIPSSFNHLCSKFRTNDVHMYFYFSWVSAGLCIWVHMRCAPPRGPSSVRSLRHSAHAHGSYGLHAAQVCVDGMLCVFLFVCFTWRSSGRYYCSFWCAYRLLKRP